MKKIILKIIGVICMILLIAYFCLTYVVLPVNSSNKMLTILNQYGVAMRKITLVNYTKDELVSSYVLNLTVEPRLQIPQKYDIPQPDGGSIKIFVDCLYGETFSVEYDNADELYENGLLIYTITDLDTTIEIDGIVYQDRYICFKSGENQIAFVERAGSSEWQTVYDLPKLNRIEKKWMGYSPIPYDENQWVKQ